MFFFKKKLLNSSRTTKQIIVSTVDFLSIVLATVFAIYISDWDLANLNLEQLLRFIWVPFLGVIIFALTGVYRSIVRYIDFSFIYLLIFSILVAFCVNLIFQIIVENVFQDLFSSSTYAISFEGWAAGLFCVTVLLVGSRLLANYYFSDHISGNRVVIYGAGAAGIQLASALRVSSEMRTIAFIDNKKSLHNTYLGGIKVLPPRRLKKLAHQGKVDEVLIAIPSASKSTLRNLLKEIENYAVKVRILPGFAELAQGKVLVSELKEVDISDLLGRFEVEANQDLINKNIRNKVVLITGAGGSIGSEISRQVAKNDPKKIILLDANEYALYLIKQEIDNLKNIEVYSVLANVTNKKRILEVCHTFSVDTIYHTAAYKHVPLVEENPFEAFHNNIIGTRICADAAQEAKVETFVLISTDKAVRPSNIMGATKRFAEQILQSIAEKSSTRMIMVRFGNVLGSSGSAVPLFIKQIKEGGPVTVTHPEVIRYFMSIPEAAELVIQAGAMGQGGDVFVLDMGEPVKIYELAKRLIKLSGMDLKDNSNPDGDIEITFTGLRPGEKLYEELLIGDNVSTTEHKQILRAEEEHISASEIERYIELLKDAEKTGDVTALRDILKKVVTGFSPEKEIVDVLYLQK